MNFKIKQINITKLIPTLGIIFTIVSALFLPLKIEAVLALFLLPLTFCLGMLIKRWWICGALYIAVYIYSRINMFSGEYTLLAIIFNLLVIAILGLTTYQLYKLRKGVKNEVKV